MRSRDSLRRAITNGTSIGIVLLAVLVGQSCSNGREEGPVTEKQSADGKTVRITVLYDNNEHDERLETAWRGSCLVEGLQRTILFDAGGSFKIPPMVLIWGVPMRIAIGTSSAMVAATALMGFISHSAAGGLNLAWALPAAAAAVVGGLLGGPPSLKTDPDRLKKLFAYTTLAAALLMVTNAVLSGA